MKSMRIRGAGILLLAALLTVGALGPNRAVAQTVKRDLSEFIEAQGTFDFMGIQFFPPVPNFITFTDPETELAISVDYAGVADAACGGLAGTKFEGEVTETELPDGRALVTVELETENAITWVLDGLSLSSPVFFGTQWQDIEGECVFDAPPTLGESELEVSFIIPEPGAPLPDLFVFLIIDVGLADMFPDQIPEGLELLTLSFEAEAEEELGDDIEAEAEAEQEWVVVDGAITFPEEKVELEFDD